MNASVPVSAEEGELALEVLGRFDMCMVSERAGQGKGKGMPPNLRTRYSVVYAPPLALKPTCPTMPLIR